VPEIIEAMESTGDEMVVRWPSTDSGAIRSGSQLVVRESQSAVFFRDGKGYDVLGPGRHTLTTLNVPLITGFLGLPFGFKSPFRAEVYFVNQRVFTNLKWGTPQPIVFRDKELKMVRLRAFGIFSPRITDPLLFINKIVGTQGLYTSDRIETFLREIIVARLNDLLGEILESIFDLPKYYDELAAGLKTRVAEDFGKYGIEVVDLVVNAITPPEDVQKMIDARTGMAAVGDMGAFSQYQAARAMRDIANQPGGEGGAGAGNTAAAGMGLGVGAGLGMMMPGMIQKAQKEGEDGGAGEEKPGKKCPHCSADLPAEAKFCLNCGKKIGGTITCPGCNAELPEGAKFCLSCGKKLVETLKCPECEAELTPGTKFCSNCGAKIE
jgi:membrane protease subunit (stomatin/prohibitin family)